MVHEVELEVAVQDRARTLHGTTGPALPARTSRMGRIRRWIGASVMRLGERIAGDARRELGLRDGVTPIGVGARVSPPSA